MQNHTHDESLRNLIQQSLAADSLAPSAELRQELERRAGLQPASDTAATAVVPAGKMPALRSRRWQIALLVTAALVLLAFMMLPERWRPWTASEGVTLMGGTKQVFAPSGGGGVAEVVVDDSESMSTRTDPEPTFNDPLAEYEATVGGRAGDTRRKVKVTPSPSISGNVTTFNSASGATNNIARTMNGSSGGASEDAATLEPRSAMVVEQSDPGEGQQYGDARHWSRLTKKREKYQSEDVGAGGYVNRGGFKQGGNISGGSKGIDGYTVLPPVTETRSAKTVTPRVIVQESEEELGLDLVDEESRLATIATIASKAGNASKLREVIRKEAELQAELSAKGPNHPDVVALKHAITAARESFNAQDYGPNSEQYDAIHDNPFLPVGDAPLSTFSIDVDTASYSNLRRFLTQGQLPPRNAVRIEELLNYFRYDYPEPKGEDPFSVNMETAPCPWQPEHLLLRVGLRGKEIHKQERPASNLVFLVDVSGSMSSEDKLPLVKQSLTMLARELGENDRITIVTYAGEAGLRMEPTGGHNQEKITAIINGLSAGGSTHGSAGIAMAYDQARAAFIKEGTNRVILCTDGDLNVGVTSDDALVDLITREAKSNVFLTVLGFGTGNLKDSKMEKLADHGNGVYAYIDGLREAKKVLVEQLSGSLTTIAKDVKIQIEFNPAQVRNYRLIGYENRVLAAKDFNDDTKDAGEIGAGHTVTALYELVPADAPVAKAVIDDLKYQKAEEEGEKGRGGEGEKKDGEASKELLTLKLRYKQPDGEVSKKLEYPLVERGTKFGQASSDFRFAAAVAGFGMILRDSPHRGAISLSGVSEIAGSSLGKDEQGYRAEFLDLIRRAEKLGER